MQGVFAFPMESRRRKAPRRHPRRVHRHPPPYQYPVPLAPRRIKSRWDGPEAAMLEEALRWARAQPALSPAEAEAAALLLELTRPYVLERARQWRQRSDGALSVGDLVNAGELELLALGAWRRFAPGAAGPGRTLWPAYALKLAGQAMARALQGTAPVYVTRHARRARKRARSQEAAVEPMRYRSLEGGEWVEREAARAPIGRKAPAFAGATAILAEQGLRAVGLEKAAHVADPLSEALEDFAAQAEAVEAMRALPRAMRFAVAGPLGLLNGGEVATDLALAAMLGANVAKVKALRAQGLAQLRATLGG